MCLLTAVLVYLLVLHELRGRLRSEQARQVVEGVFVRMFEAHAGRRGSDECESCLDHGQCGALRYFRYDRETMFNLHREDLIHPDDLEKDRNDLLRLVEARSIIFSVEKRYFRRDGSIFWSRTTQAAHREPGGGLINSPLLLRMFPNVIAFTNKSKRWRGSRRKTRAGFADRP
jgi:hypothetical protein